MSKLMQSLIDISESLEDAEIDIWHWSIISPIAKRAITHIETLEAENKRLKKIETFIKGKLSSYRTHGEHAFFSEDKRAMRWWTFLIEIWEDALKESA